MILYLNEQILYLSLKFHKLDVWNATAKLVSWIFKEFDDLMQSNNNWHFLYLNVIISKLSCFTSMFY